MRTYSIYEIAGGMFTGKTLTCMQEHAKTNVPNGFNIIEGRYDHLSQRVDVNTGKVVDYQPPQPSPNHKWDAITKRWLYVKTDADIAAEVRLQRGRLIAQSDWLITRQQETGMPIPNEWKAYRQALRDITKQQGFPRNINWPITPV